MTPNSKFLRQKQADLYPSNNPKRNTRESSSTAISDSHILSSKVPLNQRINSKAKLSAIIFCEKTASEIP